MKQNSFSFDLAALEPRGKFTLLKCSEAQRVENRFFAALAACLNDGLCDGASCDLPVESLTNAELDKAIHVLSLLQRSFVLTDRPMTAEFCAALASLCATEALSRIGAAFCAGLSHGIQILHRRQASVAQLN
jgi:hypothetical protein